MEGESGRAGDPAAMSLELSASEAVLIVSLVVLSPLVSLVFARFAANNQNAYLKLAVQAWHSVFFAVAIPGILFIAAFPHSRDYWKLAFNCLAQLLSITGLLETWQFRYSMPRMLMLKETNRAFIMRCVEAYACAIVLVTIMLGIYINKGSIVLAVYRSVTVAVIGTETLGYAW